MLSKTTAKGTTLSGLLKSAKQVNEYRKYLRGVALIGSQYLPTF